MATHGDSSQAEDVEIEWSNGTVAVPRDTLDNVQQDDAPYDAPDGNLRHSKAGSLILFVLGALILITVSVLGVVIGVVILPPGPDTSPSPAPSAALPILIALAYL